MNNVISIEKAKSRKHYTRSLEYEMVANVAFERYAVKAQPDFKALLSIPVENRIPAMVNQYGFKRVCELVKIIVQEFCAAMPLPKSKKLSESKTTGIASDLILAAKEDHLSMEDLIVFFELAMTGRWGKFEDHLTHKGIMEKLESYRDERYKALRSIRDQKEAEVRLLGPVERISPEPTAIKHLFEQATCKVIPFRKIG